MTLQPDASSPGLWVNPEWESGAPGTFALIIGVSHYDYLRDGKKASKQQEGLDQLYRNLKQLQVSALTAYRFFCWLRDEYHYTGSPLAKCWLLLAPTAREKAVEPAIDQHIQHPTFLNCRRAIRQGWYETMEQLPPSSAQQSRSFFFFSGHGLEIVLDKQILLPSDYLHPTEGVLDDAISTHNLRAGLGVLKIPHQFFFLDACRNGGTLLTEAVIEGARILNEWQAGRLYRKRTAPLLYASAAGTGAFQPDDPQKGYSLYGQALLEGLRAQANADDSAAPHLIKLQKLQTFMQRRVEDLIWNTYKKKYEQDVVAGGDNREVIVAELREKAEGNVEPPSVDAFVKPRYQEVPVDVVSRSSEIDNDVRDPRNLSFDEPVSPEEDESLPGADLLSSNEQIRRIWATGRLYSFTSKRWLTDNRAYVIHRIERADADMYRFELSIPGSAGGHWLELSDGEMTFACLLPPDADDRPRYLLDLRLREGNHLGRVRASLAPGAPGRLGRAAALWEKYSSESAIDAADTVDLQFAEEAVHSKVRSPLAATVAALILLRANRRDLLHDWLRNLTDWFPILPDGPVLWVEHRLRESDETTAPTEAADWLSEVPKRGVPYTAEAFGYLVLQVDLLLRAEMLDEQRWSQLNAMQQWLRRILPFFRSGGLFSVFAGPQGTLTPELVLNAQAP